MSINQSGTILWHCLVSGATEAELADQLATTYGIAQEQAHGDVRDFLESLVRKVYSSPDQLPDRRRGSRLRAQAGIPLAWGAYASNLYSGGDMPGHVEPGDFEGVSECLSNTSVITSPSASS